MNVNELFAQVGFEPLVSAMLTDGVTVGFTVMVIVFDVAVVGDAQVALEVMTHVTTDPVARVVVVNVALLVPAFVPFTFH